MNRSVQSSLVLPRFEGARKDVALLTQFALPTCVHTLPKHYAHSGHSKKLGGCKEAVPKLLVVGYPKCILHRRSCAVAQATLFLSFLFFLFYADLYEHTQEPLEVCGPQFENRCCEVKTSNRL